MASDAVELQDRTKNKLDEHNENDETNNDGNHLQVVVQPDDSPTKTKSDPDKSLDEDGKGLKEEKDHLMGGDDFIKIRAKDKDLVDRTYDRWLTFVSAVEALVHGFLQKHKARMGKIFLATIVVAYFVYLGYAVWYDAAEVTVVLIVTGLVVFCAGWGQITRRYGDKIYQGVCVPLRRATTEKPWWKYVRRTFFGLTFIAVVLFLILDVGRDTSRITSFFGIFIFVLVGFVTSTRPSKVKWRPVVWGLALQISIGLVVMRWKGGFMFFEFLGRQVKTFLDFADHGSRFVFGENFEDHKMAFQVFPIVIFFSAIISVLYFWGVMQFVVCKIAWLVQVTLATTAIESLNAATNIFIGMAESCVLLKPFLHKLTKSELHAVMTGGFATVAGSYIALLVNVGASPRHLLSAAIMSAPAALSIAKLSYPETEESQTKTEKDVFMEKTPARNVVEAASNGAVDAVKVIASVAANLIAILGLIAFFNSILGYLGDKVGIEGLDFKEVCSYLLWPLAVIMGVEIKDARKVASLLGTKIFVDEFIAFMDLGELMKTGQLSDRSAVIATYACCGFGSVAALGIYIGALISVAPQRRGDISEVAFRAFINGNVAGFLTACVAGVLHDPSMQLGTGWSVNATVSAYTTLIPL